MSTAQAPKTDERPEIQDAEDNIREIFTLFHRGEITEKEALHRLDQARRSRHNVVERCLAYFAG